MNTPYRQKIVIPEESGESIPRNPLKVSFQCSLSGFWYLVIAGILAGNVALGYSLWYGIFAIFWFIIGIGLMIDVRD